MNDVRGKPQGKHVLLSHMGVSLFEGTTVSVVLKGNQKETDAILGFS